jgi:hypothetical protein
VIAGGFAVFFRGLCLGAGLTGKLPSTCDPIGNVERRRESESMRRTGLLMIDIEPEVKRSRVSGGVLQVSLGALHDFRRAVW